MNTNSPYPVAVETEVPPVRRFGRTSGRVLRQRSGTVLVAESQGRFTVVPAGPAPRGATAVAEVSLRPRTVVVTHWLPPVTPHESYALDAAFECRVTDPELLLEFGCWDVEPFLIRHLAQDPVPGRLLAGAGAGLDVRIREQIVARVRVRDRSRPPFIPGMTCRLTDCDVQLRARPAPGAGPAAPEPAHGTDPQDYVWDE